MRFQYKKFLAVLLSFILIIAVSLTVSAYSKYDLNKDSVVDILDLICAKKASLEDPPTVDSTTLIKIRRILLGIELDNSDAIYLPEVP